MRLLSFLSLVETHLSARSAETSGSWHRKVNYAESRAACWSEAVPTHLQISDCELADGRHSLLARWCEASGVVLTERSYFCRNPAEWEASAESIAEGLPAEDSTMTESAEPPTDEAPYRQSAIA
jgi:hypothetical protein